MVLPYAELMRLEHTSTHSWEARDAMIYALGLGMPSDPLDERQLVYVYERNLSALLTFVAPLVLERNAITFSGIDYKRALHGEIAVTLHKPIPVSGEAVVSSRMIGAWDKGPGKGAVFADISEARLVDEDEPFATVMNCAFGRSEGGFGGATEGQPTPHPIPARPADRSVSMPTLRQQALLYRQTGDLNPLHVDPATARAAGFPEPILHGLCTYGICLRAVMGEWCDYAPDAINHFAVRFAGVVYPGETIRVDMWKDADEISFEAYVEERQQKVISNGLAKLA